MFLVPCHPRVNMLASLTFLKLDLSKGKKFSFFLAVKIPLDTFSPMVYFFLGIWVYFFLYHDREFLLLCNPHVKMTASLTNISGFTSTTEFFKNHVRFQIFIETGLKRMQKSSCFPFSKVHNTPATNSSLSSAMLHEPRPEKFQMFWLVFICEQSIYLFALIAAEDFSYFRFSEQFDFIIWELNNSQ